MYQKTIRKFDHDLLVKVRKRPCIVCGKGQPSHAHHIKTRGSGGDDVPENLWPLCPQHHQEVHMIGSDTFKAKYPQVNK